MGEVFPYETADGTDFRADYADSSSIQPTSNFLLTLGSARSNLRYLRVNRWNCGFRDFAVALSCTLVVLGDGSLQLQYPEGRRWYVPGLKRFQNAKDQGIVDIDFGEIPPTVDRESIVNLLVSTLNRAFENDFHFLSDQLGRWVRHASIKFLEFDSKRVARGEALCYSRVLCRIDLVDPWRGAPIWVCLMSRLGEDPARWSDKWVGLKRDAGVFLTEIDLTVFIDQVHSIVKSNYPTLFGAEPSIVSDERITIVAVDRLAGANEWKLRILHEADIEFWPSNPHTHVSRIDALISADLTSHSTIRAGPERDEDSVAAKE